MAMNQAEDNMEDVNIIEHKYCDRDKEVIKNNHVQQYTYTIRLVFFPNLRYLCQLI